MRLPVGRRRWVTGALLVASSGLVGVVAEAQEAPRRSLRGRFGVEAGELLIESSSVEERLRGIERLDAQDTDEALEAILEAFADGGALRADPRTRLATVRALAPHAALPEVASALSQVLADDGAGMPLERLARRVAARALARAGTEDTTTALLVAVLSRSGAAGWAREALVADPPQQLQAFVEGDEVLPIPAIELLGELGDLRALPTLERQYDLVPQEGEPNAVARRRTARLALARLGSDRALTPPRDVKGEDDVEEVEALPEPKEDPAAKVRAAFAEAEIQTLRGTPKAAALVAELLGKAKTRRRAFALAERSLSPALVPTLEAVLGAKVTPIERATAARILAAIGDDRACRALAKLLADPNLATAAALGLARSSSVTARVTLERALASAKPGPARRLVLRAAIVRGLTEGTRIAGLGSALADARDSADPTDRAIGAFGGVALGDLALDDVGADPVMRGAAARGAIARGPAAWADLAPRLAEGEVAPEGEEQRGWVAAGPALLVGTGGRSVSELLTWAEGGGVLAPLAAYRVAAIDSPAHRRRLDALVNGTDSLVRAHALLGLAKSSEPTAAHRLARAYRFEVDPNVRRAIVVALSWRSEPQRTRALSLARDWDPDPELRALARQALEGRRIDPTAGHAREVAWLTLQPSSPSAREAIAGRPLAVVAPGGIAWPALAAPDGVALIPAAGPRGRARLRLAPRVEEETPKGRSGEKRPDDEGEVPEEESMPPEMEEAPSLAPPPEEEQPPPP